MGAKSAKPNIDQYEYERRFKQVSQQCQQGPVEQRHCNDICCLITFIAITLLFVCCGVYFIANARNVQFSQFSSSTNSSISKVHHMNVSHHSINYQIMRTHSQQSSTNSSETQFSMKDIPNMRPAIPIICAMGALGIVLSFLVIIGASKIPKCMIYSMIAITFVLLVIGIIVSIIFKVYTMAIIIAIVLAVWLCIFCCLKKQLQVGIMLLKVTGSFITAKPTVLLAPVFVLFISFFYFAFWLLSLIAIQFSRPQDQTTNSTSANDQNSNLSIEDILTILWMFLSVFYTYFLYYIMVFLIATAAGLWYYGIERNYLTTGLKWIWNAHIGSFTFAAMIIAIIDMMKSTAQDQQQQSNGVGAICYAILACCLRFIQQILKVLNHNAIIVMSVTSQSYIDSAKSALILIYDNFSLFVIIDIVSSMLQMIGFLFIVAIPGVIGFFLLKNISKDQETQMIFITMGVIIIVLICGMISSIVITTVTEALSSVFIFFCLDQKYRAYNYAAINRVPGDMRGLFKQMQEQEELIKRNNQYN